MIFESPLIIPVLCAAYIGAWFLFWFFARRGRPSPDPDAPQSPASAAGKSPSPPGWWGNLLAGLQRDESTFAIGVLLPWLLIVADPAIFAGTFISTGPAFLGHYRAVAYVATANFTAALLFHLIRPTAPAFLAGLLGAGALFAFGTGAVISPMALVGIIFLGVGLLGLLPFLIAHVYLVRARKSWRAACARSSRDTVAILAFLGCMLPVASSCAAHVVVERRFQTAVDEILAEDPALQQRGTETLRSLRILVDVYRLGDAYMLAAGEKRKARVAGAFESLTGSDIALATMD